jgi:hypothetical protein
MHCSHRALPQANLNSHPTIHDFSNQHKPTRSASMNYFRFSLLSLLITIASTAASREQWSGNVQMQIKRQAGATSQCSDQAMQTLNDNVSDFLQDELSTLIGTADAFSLGVVKGTTHGDNLSLITSFDCLDCGGTVPDNKSIAHILMFFMQRRKDAWLPESDSAVTEECVDYDASVVSSIVVVQTVRGYDVCSQRKIGKFLLSQQATWQNSNSTQNETSLPIGHQSYVQTSRGA